MFTAVCKPHLALNLLKRNRKINKRSDNINFIHLFCKPVCKKTLTKKLSSKEHTTDVTISFLCDFRE